MIIFPQDVFPIQLHRGGGVNVPENTLETFSATWNRRLIPEADIRTTADDVIVCFHDDNFRRILGNAPAERQNLSVEALNLTELQRIDAAGYCGFPCQRIPTLEAVFALMSQASNRMIFLDYKKIELTRLARLVRHYAIEKQVIFTSCDYELICQWHTLFAESLTMIWLPGSQEEMTQKFDRLRRRHFANLSLIQSHYHRVPGGFQLSDDFLRDRLDELKRRGIIYQVLPWLINEPQPYQHLLDLGIQSFATDYPEPLLSVYLSHYPTPSALKFHDCQ